MIRNIPVFLLLLLTACLFSCKDKDADFEKGFEGYAYFPLAAGMERTYYVDSFVYHETKAYPDSFSYQVRELLTDTFTDMSGRLVYRVEKYTRKNDSSAWKFDHVFSMSISSSTAEVNDHDLRTVKLTFPIYTTTRFNTNMFNSLPATESRVTELNKPALSGAVQYDSTLAITVRNDSDYLKRDLFQERYAIGIGLVTSEFVKTEKIVVGTDVKYNGVKYFYRLRSFSK